jgi:hypothetical protein
MSILDIRINYQSVYSIRLRYKEYCGPVECLFDDREDGLTKKKKKRQRTNGLYALSCLSTLRGLTFRRTQLVLEVVVAPRADVEKDHSRLFSFRLILVKYCAAHGGRRK